MKLTNEEKRKTLGQHIGCEAIFKKENFLQITGELLGVDAYGNSFISTGRAIPAYKVCDINFSFLLLTPLSSITDEHAIEVAKMFGYKGKNNEHLINVGEGIINGLRNNRTVENFQVMTELYQYLISKGYAVPLWFGIGHWANGKTAIYLGIAIDKTTQS